MKIHCLLIRSYLAVHVDSMYILTPSCKVEYYILLLVPRSLYLQNQSLVEGLHQQGLLPPSLGDLPAFIARRSISAISAAAGGSMEGDTAPQKEQQPGAGGGESNEDGAAGPSLATTRLVICFRTDR